jgi:hypothetical protein
MLNKRLSEEQLSAFFKAQYKQVPDADGRITCSYIIEHEKYDRYHKSDICHARAFPNPDYAHHGKALAIHSTVWKYDDTSKKYIEWIFDPVKSPWRKLFTDIRLYRDDDKIKGFSLFDMDKPYRTIMNFLFATRFHSEHALMLNIFNEAVKTGFDEAVAYVLAHALLASAKPDQFHFHRYNAAHVAIYPVDHRRDGETFAPNIKRLREGNPNDNSDPYWKGLRNNYEDVNSIWFDWKNAPPHNLFNLKDLEGLPVYMGRFNRLFKVVKDDIGVKLQDNDKRQRPVTLKHLFDRQQEWI